LPRYDFRTPRLFVAAPLARGAKIPLDRAQTNYLVNVLRRRPGDGVLVFNGTDGEWAASLDSDEKRRAALMVGEQRRPQPARGDLHYMFAPLKQARQDYMAQKAVEMGATRLVPVLTRNTQVERVNLARMRANVVEAAEQCGILDVAEVGEPATLEKALAEFEPSRLMVFCDEDADVTDPVAALAAVRQGDGPMKAAVLVGPEGGFTPDERAALMGLPRVVRLALGPRILRADTAAVAALALVGAVIGDWR
jgi:16S rRNA (uracil1498-N3)-methyltransferase